MFTIERIQRSGSPEYAGSVRIPAALCGIVGFKPSAGAVPVAGAFPLSTTLDTVGPLAASVADCALADAVLRGVSAVPLQMPDLGTVAFTVPRGRLFDGVDPAVLDAFEAALLRLRARGAAVSEGSLNSVLDGLAELDRIGVFTAAELMATLAERGVRSLEGVDPRTRARIEAGRSLSAVDYVLMTRRRAKLIAQADVRLASGEVLVLPTVPTLAPLMAAMAEPAEFHRANGLLLRNPRIANLLDLPAISLPLPVRGLPVGLMLMARRGEDRRLLAVAAAVERSLIE